MAMSPDKSEKIVAHLVEMRDMLEMDIIKKKRSKPVDEEAVKSIQLTIDSLNDKIKLHKDSRRL